MSTTGSLMAEALRELSTILPHQSQKVTASSDDRARERDLQRRAELWGNVVQAIGSRYSECRVQNFVLSDDREVLARQERVVASLTAYGENVEENVRAGRGIVLFGSVGTGKDHLTVGLMFAACRAGFSVMWVNGMDLFGEMRDSIDRDESEQRLLGKYVTPDVLVISDPLPPWGPLTQFQAGFLFRLIDRRYRNRKPIWVTANFADRKSAEEKLGAQLLDRLKDGALALHCDWPSHRRTND